MGLSCLWQTSINQWCMKKENYGGLNRTKVFKLDLFKNAIIILGYI